MRSKIGSVPAIANQQDGPGGGTEAANLCERFTPGWGLSGENEHNISGLVWFPSKHNLERPPEGRPRSRPARDGATASGPQGNARAGPPLKLRRSVHRSYEHQ